MIQKRYSLVELHSDSQEAVSRGLATYWGVGAIGDFVVILPTYLFDPSKISKIELDFKLSRKPSGKLLSTLLHISRLWMMSVVARSLASH